MLSVLGIVSDAVVLFFALLIWFVAKKGFVTLDLKRMFLYLYIYYDQWHRSLFDIDGTETDLPTGGRMQSEF